MGGQREKVEEWVGGRMDIRGVYMFSSLMKQNKKAKICFVICFAGKKKLLFYIYAVIVKQKIYKRSSNYYLHSTRSLLSTQRTERYRCSPEFLKQRRSIRQRHTASSGSPGTSPAVPQLRLRTHH
jgi:hypothetical protein